MSVIFWGNLLTFLYVIFFVASTVVEKLQLRRISPLTDSRSQFFMVYVQTLSSCDQSEETKTGAEATYIRDR